MTTNKTDKPLVGRVALVTGASRGLGYAIALQLAQKGAHIVALARTRAGLEELDDAIRQETGESATLMPVNMLRLDELLNLGPILAEKFGRLDILVGNAGMLGTLTPTAHIKTREWDDVMNLNLNANHRLIMTLDPLLRASDAGRAVFVGSRAGEFPRSYWATYGISKAALHHMVLSYAQEVDNTALKVNIFDPGGVRTAMRAKALPGEDPTTLPTPDDVATRLIPHLLPDATTHGQIIRGY